MNRPRRPQQATAARGRVLVLWLAAALHGCAVGPDFLRPAEPALDRYTAGGTREVMASEAGEASQRLRVGEELSAQWWELFRAPALNAVLSQAIDGNLTLAAARASLAQARENVAAARGGLFPQLDAGLSATRQRSAALFSSGGPQTLRGSAAQLSNSYSLGPTVSYVLDVFGGTRRKVEQQQALAEFQGYEVAAAYLTLTGNAVMQAIAIAGLQAQIQATEEVIAEDRRNLALVRAKFEAGKAARTDVLTAETQLASDLTGLPPLRQQLSSARHALSILTGRAPAEWSPPAFELGDFTLPRNLPLSLPSALVRQRPDILATEAQLHAASAAIGVATAQLYPSITLTAAIGQEALSTAALFNSANTFWNLGAGLTAPLFHGGTLRAERRAAVDAFQASLATYQQTVLQGFQQVADSLQALAHDAELVGAERQVLATARVALALQRESYAAGKADILQLLDAERTYQQSRLGYARAQTQRLQDTVQLFVALGGGWWKGRI